MSTLGKATHDAIFGKRMSIDDDVEICHATSDGDFTRVQFLFRAYFMPLTYLFGIISNAINAIVFSQKAMRSQPVNWFFLVLSISDFTVLVSSFFVFSVPVYAESSRDLEVSKTSVYLIVWFYPLAQTGLTMSVYVTILVSVHRYLGVCHPFLIRRISNSSVVKLVVATAVVFAFVFNTSRWFELYAMPCYSDVYKRNSVIVFPTELMLDNMYTLVYRNAAYTLVMFFLPFATLTFVNLRIIGTLQKSYKMRREMLMCQRAKKDLSPADTIITKYEGYSAVTSVEGHNNNNFNSANANERKENGVTIMLVAMTTEFLLFNVLAFANNIIELMNTYGHKLLGDHSYVETLLVEVSALLVNINGATTIVVYLVFGSKYRSVFLRLLQKHVGVNFCPQKRSMFVGSQAPYETTQLLDSRLHHDSQRCKNKQFAKRSETNVSSDFRSSRRKDGADC